MAAPLVTLAQAKDHLGISQGLYTRDADVQLKLDQAEAIVLDYLKNPIRSIASISAANPAVVTTLVPHGLISGVTYTIAGTTTTPDVNGARVVTVTGATTFTVPVNVTVGQSDEAGLVGTRAWTDATVPGVVTAAILLMLGRLFEHRGDLEEEDAELWLSIERLLMRQRDPALA